MAHSKAPGTGDHESGCQGKIRSGKLGSVESPTTQACISFDHDATVSSSPFRTRTGVPSSGAVSIGSQSTAPGEAGSCVAIHAERFGPLLSSLVPALFFGARDAEIKSRDRILRKRT